ncbi:MAG: hypothetical protein JXQ68_01150 [Campylobacterales bacterium]|nr:hypothetical protein [Campylobacterales bacterium]
MSDTVATFWIISKQGEVFELGDSPKPRKKELAFKLTEENYNSWGYITIQIKGVSYSKNRVLLNDHFVGYLDPTPNDIWVEQTLIVEVYDKQLFGDGPTNKLVIESNNHTGGSDGNLDDFSFKHVIFHYRTNR